MSSPTRRRRKRVKSSPSGQSVQSATKKHRPVLSQQVTDCESVDSEGSEDSDELLKHLSNMPPKFNKEDLKEVADALMCSFRDQLLSEIKDELNTMIMVETEKLKSEINDLKKENQTLKVTMKATNASLDDLDQYGRRMCLEIANIPGDTGNPAEDVEQKVLHLTQTHNVDLTSSDIDRCHRLGRYQPSASVNRRIIIRFTNSKARQRIYDCRRSLGDGIFVQEHLTKFRSQLAYEARQLVRAKTLAKTWIAGSKVFATLIDKGKEIKIQIRDMDDIKAAREGKPPAYSR